MTRQQWKTFFIHMQAIYPPVFLAFFVFIVCYALLGTIDPAKSGLTLALVVTGTIASPLFILDAIQRFRRYEAAYKYLKAKEARVLALLQKERIAWCTRESVKAACRRHSEDLYQKAQRFYRDGNIKPYHILPLGLFSKGSPAFKLSYWKSALFDPKAPNYFEDLHK